jgi:hypothetical protein
MSTDYLDPHDHPWEDCLAWYRAGRADALQKSRLYNARYLRAARVNDVGERSDRVVLALLARTDLQGHLRYLRHYIAVARYTHNRGPLPALPTLGDEPTELSTAQLVSDGLERFFAMMMQPPKGQRH